MNELETIKAPIKEDLTTLKLSLNKLLIQMLS